METTQVTFESNVYQWAKSRNLVFGTNWYAQYAKLVEEVGELGAACVQQNQVELMDAIGDCCVVLTILAAQHGVTLCDCQQAAWDRIKNRTGSTINGVFVKDGDD